MTDRPRKKAMSRRGLQEKYPTAPCDTEPDGLTVPEIAERLGLAQSTVRLDIRTALKKMRRLLTEDQ